MDAHPGVQNAALDAPSGAEGARPEPQALPVALRGKMTPDGYLPENDAWADYLLQPDDETGRTTSTGEPRLIGSHPFDIPVDVLTSSGHPPRNTARFVNALSKALELDLSAYGLKRHKDLRRYCLDRAENSAEVRRCAVINCPFWPYRMGRNPHNPQRGQNPFKRESSGGADGNRP